jgi:hypothetical protein
VAGILDDRAEELEEEVLGGALQEMLIPTPERS